MCQKPFDKNFTKTTGVFVNLLYMIASLVMMGFGISIKATPNYFLSMYGHYGLDVRIVGDKMLEASAIFMIVVSVIAIFTAIYGFYCFHSESDLIVYAAMQLFLIVLNVVMIIFTATYPSKDLMREKMNKTMIDSFNDRDIKVDNSSAVTYFPADECDHAWATTQLKTSCCGIDGPKDYLRIPDPKREEDLPNFGKRVLEVPLSCCATKPDTDGMVLLDFEECVGNSSLTVNRNGCFSSVMVYYAYSAVSVYRIAPILILFEIALTFLALKFNYDLKNYELIA